MNTNEKSNLCTDTDREPQYVVAPVVDTSPAGIAVTLLDKGVSVEQIEKMLEIQLRWEANESRKEYLQSMATAQANMPIVPRKAENKQTNSTYAKYEDVMVLAKPTYTKEGFSITYYEEDSPIEKSVRICADIMHRAGHIEKRHVDVPMDDVGIKGTANKTQTHAKKSSISYGKGMLLCMIFNIPTGEDVDDDGNSAGGTVTITDEQAQLLKASIGEIYGDKAQTFLDWLGVKEIGLLQAKDFNKAKGALDDARKRKAAK